VKCHATIISKNRPPSHHHPEMSFVLCFSAYHPNYTINTIQEYSESPRNSPLAQQEQSTQNMSLGESLKAHFLEMSCLVIFFPDRLWPIRDETWETEGGLFPKHLHIQKPLLFYAQVLWLKRYHLVFDPYFSLRFWE
jgi:hypothetical protein